MTFRKQARARRLTVSLFFAGCCAAALGQAPVVCFSPGQSVSAEPSDAVAVGDFNADGNLDLAATAPLKNAVDVFLGDGTGRFGPAVRYPVASPSFVITADVNRDGRLDLVVTTVGASPLQDSGAVRVLLGTGSGEFGSANTVAITPPLPIALDVGDLNGDGNPDLAVALYGASAILVLLGDGTGAFPVAHQHSVPPQSVFSVTIGHLNADANPDLVTQADFSHTVWVLLGTGGGNFGTPQPFPGGLIPYTTVLRDFNEDGRPDVAVATGGTSNMALLLGDGNGNLSAPVLFGSGNGARWIAGADFNLDGHQDVVVAHAGLADSIRFFLGSGTGTFTGPFQFAVGSFPRHVLVGDFNSDGRLDVAAANFSGVTVSINGPAVSPPSLSPGTVGVAYPSTSFTAEGGVAPFSLSLSGALPAGITFTPATGTLSGTPTQAGTFPVSVTASSSDGCTATRSYSLVVSRGATTLTLSSSANPALAGQPIVLTATVSGAGTPTGTVTFFAEAPTILGTVPLSGGIATLTLPGRPVGTIPIGATYSGDANFLPSTAPPFPQGVVSADIPTLDGRALLVMGILLAAAGLFLARRVG